MAAPGQERSQPRSSPTMATRSCREKAQKQNEQHQAILAKLLREEDNKYCADCEAKGTRGGEPGPARARRCPDGSRVGAAAGPARGRATSAGAAGPAGGSCRQRARGGGGSGSGTAAGRADRQTA